jgi:hypothetical protein
MVLWISGNGAHINRFGRCELDLDRRPLAIDYNLALFADNDRALTTASGPPQMHRRATRTLPVGSRGDPGLMP